MPKSGKKSLRRSMHRSKTTKACRVCGLPGEETFHFLKRSFVFDVDEARRITQDGRKPVELDRSDVLHAVDTARIYIEHIPHVRLGHPGIIARVRCTGVDGSTIEGDLLIDGHHRAAKSLQLGVPYLVYLLTVDETDAVLKRRPDRLVKKSSHKRPTAGKKAAAEKARRGAKRRPTKAAIKRRSVAEKQRRP